MNRAARAVPIGAVLGIAFRLGIFAAGAAFIIAGGFEISPAVGKILTGAVIFFGWFRK